MFLVIVVSITIGLLPTHLETIHVTTFVNGLRLDVPKALLFQPNRRNLHESIKIYKDDCLHSEVVVSADRTKKKTKLSLRYPVFLKRITNDYKISQLILKMMVFNKCIDENFACNIFHDKSNKVIQTIDSLPRELLDSKSKEMVDWVGTNKEILCPLQRSTIHNFNLLHHGIGAIIINKSNKKIFIHKRSGEKRLFPSMLDMFVGGVSVRGESIVSTLIRELNEECGIDLQESEFIQKSGKSLQDLFRSCTNTTQHALLLSQSALEKLQSDDGNEVKYLGETIIQTRLNHCVVDCFAVLLSDLDSQRISFKDGEIEWGKFVTAQELLSLLANGKDSFVPDGIQVMYYYLS